MSLDVRWNNARLVVHLKLSPSISTTSTPIENTFIQKFNSTSDEDDGEEAERLSGEFLDAVVEIGRHSFDRLAPPTAQLQDLHTVLFPKEYNFLFRTSDGKGEVVRGNDAMKNQVLLGPSGQPFHLSFTTLFPYRLSPPKIFSSLKILWVMATSHV